MTHILIVYGTTDGHTRKIAQVLAENLRARRCSVDLVDAAGSLWRMRPGVRMIGLSCYIVTSFSAAF